jgi:hypothetical protein
MRIADKAIAPRQARDDDDRKRDEANCAVHENGIGRRAPSGAAARDEPESYSVAADRGRQRLVEAVKSVDRAHKDQCAVRLGRYFGNRAQFWLDLQSQYDIAVIERERGAEIARRVRPADAA